jgi:hypothetical protein
VNDRALDLVLVHWIWPDATQNAAGSFPNRLWNDAEFDCTYALPTAVRFDMRCGDV